MTPGKKQFNGRFRCEKTVRHPALEFFLATLFFLMLILTAIAFFLFSPLTPTFQR
jgi:hypothetical protein